MSEPDRSTQFDFLNAKFIEAMNDIGRYGFDKYGDTDVLTRCARGERWRDGRLTAASLHSHSSGHFNEYRAGILHDHFGTKRHQLAAVAFNAMIEFMLADLGNE